MRVVFVAGLLLLTGPAAGATSSPPERLVFANDRTGTFQLYAVSLSGAGLTQLSFGDLDACDPTPAPNGRWLVFTRSRERPPAGLQRLGCRRQRPQIWVARADGSRARALAGGSEPSWRPDAQRLIFVDGQGIVSIKPDGTGWRRITDQPADRAPQWSPTGRALLVRRGEQLVVIGGGRTRVLAARALAGAWSPDARWIAYTTGSSVAVVRHDGRARRTLVAGATFLPGFGRRHDPTPVWSPDGRSIADVDTNGAAIVNVANRAVRRIGKEFQRPVWSRDGRRLALVDATGLSWVSARYPQQRSRVYTADSEDQLTEGASLGYLVGQGSGRVEAIPPLVTVTDRELRSRHGITDVVAVDGRLLYRLCDGVLGVWRPGSPGIVQVGPNGIHACGSRHYDSQWLRPALGGDRAAWLETDGGIGITVTLMTGRLGTSTVTQLANARGTAGPADQPELGYVLGDGRDLVYSTWQRCTACPFTGGPDERIVSQTLYRLDGTSAKEIASAEGRLEPLDLDRGRLVLRRPSALELRDREGALLLSIPVERVLGAELSGTDLAVLRAGELRHYDASTGELAHTWPLPDLPSAGRCRQRNCPATPRLTLVSVARGLALYTIDTNVYLLRLRDGATAALAQADLVDLDPTGIYTTTRGERIVPATTIHFTPFDDLPLR